MNIFLLFVVGLLANGPYALITTAVSADLGTHPVLKGSTRALATVRNHLIINILLRKSSVCYILAPIGSIFYRSQLLLMAPALLVIIASLTIKYSK